MHASKRNISVHIHSALLCVCFFSYLNFLLQYEKGVSICRLASSLSPSESAKRFNLIVVFTLFHFLGWNKERKSFHWCGCCLYSISLRCDLRPISSFLTFVLLCCLISMFLSAAISKTGSDSYCIGFTQKSTDEQTVVQSERDCGTVNLTIF